MSLFNYYIKRGISQGIGRAIGGAVEKAIAPAANEIVGKTIAPAADQAAQNLNHAAGQFQESYEQAAGVPAGTANTAAAGSLGGLFASMQTAAMTVANEAAKNMKVCSECGEPTTADKKFCPSCGALLPEKTAAEMAAEEAASNACPSCGHENAPGTKFCGECGTRLPEPIEELAEEPVEEKPAFCTNCGTKYEAGMKFCMECGSKLE